MSLPATPSLTTPETLIPLERKDMKMDSITEIKCCPRCGSEMELKEKSYAMGSALFTNRFHVNIYACPKCNHVELFATEGELVTCPVCGTKHPAREKCAICSLNTVLDGKYGR